ncbi:MAG: DSD1 family PLP-dependent enzyme, partial [Candidatus Methylomirabilota bacterium]
MMTRPQAEVGMPLEAVDTPALLLELDAFERNLARLAQAVAGTLVRLRPHSKSHKCPVIALRQMAAGAVGVCCQKVSEAEAMVFGGVSDVLVSNQIVGAPKIARLVALAKQARVA